MSEGIQQNWIASFWRKIGALVVDTLLLGLVGFLLGLAFESTFVQIVGWGRFIGFLIALIYFGVMSSHLSAGQTIGKKILNLRVIDSDNQTVSLGRTVLRYIVLAAPFSVN